MDSMDPRTGDEIDSKTSLLFGFASGRWMRCGKQIPVVDGLFSSKLWLFFLQISHSTRWVLSSRCVIH